MSARTIALRLVVVGALSATGCTESADERREEIYAWKADPSDDNLASIRARLDDDQGDVRATALHALIELHVPDAGALAIGGLSDPDAFVRKTAAHALEGLADEGAVTALGERVTEDEDFGVRKNAAAALTAIGTEAALAFLVTALEDPVKEVRLEAVRGIVKRDPELAIDTFVSMVLQDPAWEVRVQAAAALGMSTREDVVPILEEAVNDPSEFVRAAVSKALESKASSRVPEGDH